MIYTDQLRMPRWQQRRLRIFERDGFACAQCGNTESELQVHHKDYFPGVKAWEYPDNDLTTLCKKCHSKENERESHEKYLLQSLKTNGFSAFQVLALACYINKYPGFAGDIKNLINNAIRNNL